MSEHYVVITPEHKDDDGDILQYASVAMFENYSDASIEHRRWTPLIRELWYVQGHTSRRVA